MDTRLTRSRDDRMIAGVAGGLADYLGIDPSLVRIAWVVLFLAGGLGLLIYIIMWIVVPEEDELTPDELLAATTGSSVGPAAAGAATGASSAVSGVGSGPVDWRTQRSAEREARRAARRARRASGDNRTPALLIGGFLVVIGVAFLLRDFIPAINFDYIWPFMLVVLGVLILAAAFRPRRSSGNDDRP